MDINHLNILMAVMAVTSLIKWELVRSGFSRMSSRQYQEKHGLSCHFCFGLQQERLCKTDLSGLKLSVSIANPCSKLLHTEVC